VYLDLISLLQVLQTLRRG